MTTLVEITGRDSYLTAKALFYAIAYIQELPPEKQAHSDLLDMCEIAKTLPHDAIAQFKEEVFAQTGNVVILDPAP